MQGYFRFESYINSQTTNNNNNKSCARHVQGYIIMKKTIVLGLAALMALAASVTAFASVSDSRSECNHHDGIHEEVAVKGKGACRHAGCKCTWYIRAKGGAGKCVCGHWDYVHN